MVNSKVDSTQSEPVEASDWKKIAGEMFGLDGVLVVAMPDGLLFDAWTGREFLDLPATAAFASKLVDCNRDGLRAMGAWSSDMQVVVQSTDALLVVAELRMDFCCVCSFSRDTPYGMVCLELKRLLSALRQALPQYLSSGSDEVAPLLSRYAPDPERAARDLAKRAGLGVRTLEELAKLSKADREKMAGAAKRMLARERLGG